MSVKITLSIYAIVPLGLTDSWASELRKHILLCLSHIEIFLIILYFMFNCVCVLYMHGSADDCKGVGFPVTIEISWNPGS